MNTPKHVKHVKRLLIVGPAWVGDMVMAQALFKAVKQLNPFLQLDVLAPPWCVGLLARMPEVDTTLTLPLDHGKLGLKIRYQCAQSLKYTGYQWAILLPNSWKSALIPWWAKIPRRTGWIGEYRFGLLNDIRKLNKQAIPRMVDRFVALAYEPGTPLEAFEAPTPQLTIDSTNRLRVLKKFSLQPAQQPILALCPGAEFGSSKRWPERHYATVALEKLEQGWAVWLFGSKNDISVAMAIQAMTNNQCVDLTGRTELNEAIDLLSLATAVVANDSGLMHIAAALNKPLIAIYGSTHPNFAPPLHPTAQVIYQGLTCSPCAKRVCPLKHHDCMEKLMPDQILAHFPDN